MLTLFSFHFCAMGSDCALHLYANDGSDAERVAKVAIAEVMRIEQRYSRYRSDSDLAAINRAAKQGVSVDVDKETAALLDYSFAVYATSDGLFDITSGLLRRAWDFKSGRIPEQKTIDELLPRIGLDKLQWQAPRLGFSLLGMELDFGGLGKEYAVDRVAEICPANGIHHGLVELGGDIRVFGPHPDGTAWQIGIQHPEHCGEIIGSVSLKWGALATSGDYERCIRIDRRRYSHILDPRTGWPVEGLRSVTALAERCMVAGSVSTLAMLKGPDGVAWLRSVGIDHVWLDQDGHCGWAGQFTETARLRPQAA